MTKQTCDNEVLESGAMLNKSHADDEELARLSAALGHPSRVAILRLLREREVCICGEIVQLLPQAQSTVSQHLKVLRDSGWIIGATEGTRVCYSLDKNVLKRFGSLIRSL